MDEKSQEKQKVLALLHQLGTAYLNKSQYDEAIERFSKLIELGGGDATTYLNLSKAYILKKQYDEKAVQIFRKALDYDPENKDINIVLSQIYLNSNRDDDEAYRVYRRTLQYHPENTKDLILALIKIDCKKGNYNSARLLAEESLVTNPYDEDLIPYFVYFGWKQQLFTEVANRLKKIVSIKHNPVTLKWLAYNFIESLKNAIIAKKKYKIKLEDFQYCENYLSSVDRFERLNDIYIYLSVRNFVENFIPPDNFDDNQSIHEYELFLAEDSFSNIWDKALNKKTIINSSFNFSQEIWNKITSGGNDKSRNNIDQITLELNQFTTLMLIQIVNYDDLILLQNFDVLINEELNKALTPLLRRTNDGYFIIANDTGKSVSVALNIFKRSYELYKNKGDQDRLKFRIIINHLNFNNPEELLNDLNILFEAQQIDSDFFNGIISNDRNKIWVTEAAYDLIEQDNSFNSKLSQTLKFPRLSKLTSLYEINLKDSVDSIRSGLIKQIDRFRILSNIQSNNLFVSFKAVDTFLDRLIVLKILRPYFDNNLPQVFIEQASRIGKLNHANIAIIYDIGEDKGFCYIVREFVEGDPLTVFLADFDSIDWPRAVEICQQVAEALSSAHQMGIIHGRINPSNIFILDTDEVKITDFSIPGFSTQIKDPNLIYASPEQISNKQIDHRSDIYSLGVILYELLTGENPFYDEHQLSISENVINIDPPHISTRNNKIPPDINTLIAKAIAKRPQDRYDNTGQFIRELQNFIEENQ